MMRFVPIGLASLAACQAETQPNLTLPAADPGLDALAHCRHAPDGDRIVGLSEAAGQTDLELLCVPSSGGDARRLGTELYDATFVGRPVWSPDGARVAVVHAPPIDALDESIRLIVHEPERETSATIWSAESRSAVHALPAWSTDGTMLAVASETNAGMTLDVLHLTGALAWSDRIEDERWGWASLSFSPDGGRLALVGCHRFVVYDAATHARLAEREITFVDSEASSPPLWLADGRWIVCAGKAAWLVDASREEDERLFGGAPIVDVVRWPASERLLGLRERALEPSGIVGVVETLASAGHPRDRYETVPLVHDLATGEAHALDEYARVGHQPWQQSDRAAHPAVRQAFSRWR